MRQEQPRARRLHPRRPQGRCTRRPPELPADRRGDDLRRHQLRHRVGLGRRRVRADVRPHPAATSPTCATSWSSAATPVDGQVVAERLPGRRRRAAGARSAAGHDDLHVGHHRAPEGCGQDRGRRASSSPGASSTCSATCPTTSTSPAGRSTTRGPVGSPGSPTRSATRSWSSTGSTPRTGSGSLDTYRCDVVVLGSDADPDDLRPARRREGAVRHVLDAGHGRQRRAVELRAQGGLPRRLPGGVAVGGVRLDRARGEHRARSRRPAPQARFVRPACAGCRRRALHADGAIGRHRARRPRRTVRAGIVGARHLLQGGGEVRRRPPRGRLAHRRRHRLRRRRGLLLHLRPQDRHDHLRRR